MTIMWFLLFLLGSLEQSTQCVDLIDKAGRMQVECKLSQAEKYYSEAIHLCGESSFLYSRLGTTHFLLGSDEQAREDYQAAIGIARDEGRIDYVELLTAEMKSLGATSKCARPCYGKGRKTDGKRDGGN